MFLFELMKDLTRPWLIVPEAAHLCATARVVTYGEMLELTERIGAALQAKGIAPGEPVAVLAENTIEGALLLLGVLVAGATLVPVAPPALGETRAAFTERLARIRGGCDVKTIVGSTACLAANVLPQGFVSHAFEELASAVATLVAAPRSGSDVVLTQFTSGTTVRPRGVALNADNLTANIQAIGAASEVRPDDVVLCWIPLFHDMGLIGTLLWATYWNLPTVLMTPRSFLTRPESWLWAISRFSVTWCAAPNSAYRLCATRLSDAKLAGLDLSSWRVACNGSELVQPSTLTAFARRFASHGFHPSAMCPVYGLAEHTVAATFPTLSRRGTVEWVEESLLAQSGVARARGFAQGSRGVVGVGRALPGHSVGVLDPETMSPLEDGKVGEIVLRGPSAMSGYYNAPEATAAALVDGWLRTGDRGYLREGELFVVGRSKDVIKRGGVLLDAGHIASALQQVDGVRGGNVAVFGVSNQTTGMEEVVVVAEAEPCSENDRRMLSQRLVAVARDTLSVPLDRVVFVRAGRVPKTTSGKVQHGRAREMYLQSAASRNSGGVL